ncbi:integrative and conjugative element protein, VC0181 family [Flavobacterium fontis]|uniref:Integrative and conjugative element protein, VC0181 family n=1 Tax=Flavobacterium fontis TaxID=1124188 RepID=A0A1M4WA28_9FLAO|nr:Mov34/MPN/PAD-1 family protein [Flavobacterium fontis]SHE78086.1 integrative and conjugative element protein, VC0181 family [Flavobacterium fontis]
MINIEVGVYNIFFSKKVLNDIKIYKQDTKEKNESGGILLGQVLNQNIYVLKYSDPCKSDKSTRYSFERDKKNAQKIINHEFAESSGKTIYLGEWHTHPEKLPTPSNQDLKMIKEQYKKNKLNEKFLILFILGTQDFYIGIYTGKEIISKTLPLK